jgi:hypothetical protein
VELKVLSVQQDLKEEMDYKEIQVIQANKVIQVLKVVEVLRDLVLEILDQLAFMVHLLPLYMMHQ